MRGVAALAAIYVVLGAAVAGVAGAVGTAWREPLRWAVLFALPLLVGALGAVCVPRPQPGPPRPRREPILLAGLLAGLDLAPIGVGFLLHQLTFTYGDQDLAAGRPFAIVLGLPAAIAVTVWGWERGLRERLAGGARAAGAPGLGAALSIGCGAALSWVVFAPGFELMDTGFGLAAAGCAVLREATALRLYGTGGTATSGLYRGLLAGVEGLLIADWASFWFPSANFVSSDPGFAWLRLAGPALALGLAVALTRKVRA